MRTRGWGRPLVVVVRLVRPGVICARLSHLPLWFAVRASDAFSRDYPSRCAFRLCLAVYGPYSASGGVVAALMLWLRCSRVGSVFICWRAYECPWLCVAGALILFAAFLARLVFGRGSPVLRVRSLIVWVVKRGVDACAVGGDACAAALEAEVWVFCFPTVACGVVGEECGA